MSSQMSKKKYELKVRAESQRETRDRIARAAAELHAEKGVAQTTYAEIARRAGVSRLTVYNHFPDLGSLLPACTAHYESQHPLPDFAKAIADDDETRRVVAVLSLLYGWYRETEPVFGKAFGDRQTVPELDAFMAERIDHLQGELVTAMDRGPAVVRGRAARRRALLRLAVDFWTWRRLSREGLDDKAAARVMAEAVSR